jgi:7,8-dihydropterin-6-yl-methyl-4-(beta-D-ribofuranosyl)aminobenzene 5'-phosphate synthase
MATCTLLVENTQSYNASLKSTFGFSALVEEGKLSVLFDCGPDGTFLENARKLNKELASLSAVVLSHGHFDHANGFPALLDAQQIPCVYLGKEFFAERYSLEDGVYSYLGSSFDAKLLHQKQVKATVVDQRVSLSPSLSLVSDFSTRYPFETPPSRFVKGKVGAVQADDFSDEVALVVEHKDEVSLLVGCSHPGILSMVRTVGERFGKPVTKVCGGAHLSKVEQMRLEVSIIELERLGVKDLYLCHCSGSKITELGNTTSQCRFHSIGTGDTVLL